MTKWYDEDGYSVIESFRANLLLFVLIINNINLINQTMRIARQCVIIIGKYEDFGGFVI